MSFGGSVSVLAMKDGDYTPTSFAGTTAGLQAAIDFLLGAQGKVWVGPGLLDLTACVWIHTGCHLRGSGAGKTIIRRATGSLTDGDAADSGAIIATSAYGSNGTLSSSVATQSNIIISDLTLDGNENNFGSLTVNHQQYGLHCKSVYGLALYGVNIENTLLSAAFLNECRKVNIDRVSMVNVAQWSLSVVNNGIDFYNNAAATSGAGQELVVSNFFIQNVGFLGGPGAEAISLTRAANVSISNGYIDGCDQALEMQGGNPAEPQQENVTMTNVIAKNLRQEAVVIANNISGKSTQKITVSNCVFEFHPTEHNARAINIEGASASWANQIAFSNCHFRNINSKDTNNRNWVDISSTGATTGEGIVFSNCTFHGLATSIRTGDFGFHLNGNLKDVVITGCVLKDVAGRGFYIHDGGTRTIRDITVADCIIDGCNGRAYDITTDGGLGGTVANIRLNNCTSINAQRQGTGTAAAIIVGAGDSSTGSMSDIYLFRFKAYVTSGTTMTHGLLIYAGAGTTPSGLWIEGCDFRGATAPMIKQGSGTWSNIYFNPRTGTGTPIASATTIAIPTDGDVFHVTGATNITAGITVNVWDNGRTVKLIFDSTPTITDTGTSKLNGDFAASADCTLTLACDNVSWHELGRSIN